MATNDFTVKRTAMAHLVHPGHASVTVSPTDTGIYIPTGAIVTGIKMFTANAVTGGASLSNAVFGISVGAISIASNSNKQSVMVLQTAVVPAVLAVGTNGLYIGTGGNLLVEFVSTGGAATGVTADFDIYVDYLYASDHD